MFSTQRIIRLMVGLGLFAIACTASAQWDLDSASSSLNFISTKNSDVAEVHRFESLIGFVGDDGRVEIGIDLNSVSTGIEVRDGRMRELLFQTDSFPSANVTAEIDSALVAVLQPGTVITTSVELCVALHGQKAAFTAPVIVGVEDSGKLRVVSMQPVVVNAALFGLVDGINRLREIAGLKSISSAVPVTFSLVFNPALPAS